VARPDRTAAPGHRRTHIRRRASLLRHQLPGGVLVRVVPALIVASFALALLAASPARAAGGPTMSVHILLGGHTRVGSWLAIAVDLANDGPALGGELRLDTGSASGVRYSLPVDLPTQSQKRYVLYAQPPNAFVSKSKVVLYGTDGKTIADRPIEFTSHDPNQLLVGVVADKPAPIVGGLGLQPGPTGIAPAIVSLAPEDLPERSEALAPLDRLIWQDVDPSRLSTEQLNALRTWLGSGGRLVVIGGTAGAGVLASFPDDLLPYRPLTTVAIAASALVGLIGTVPTGAADVPAAVGELTNGRALAMSDNRPIAADIQVGSGSVTMVGFDPTVGWLGSSTATQALWRRLLPARSGTAATATADDSQLVNAVYSLPSLSLPPVTGLLALLVAYILLVGPINYLVLRRLDRREWAWVTMPALIVLFAVGAYAYGAVLRGGDVIVNEVAIVRGTAGSVAGQARVYVGVFSPTRGTYQVSIPGGALLSGTLTGDQFGNQQQIVQALDVVQGEPARVRDLAIGFGSLRSVKAEATTSLPRITASLRVDNGRLVGTISNDSQETIERPAVVLGNSSVVLDDLPPGATRDVLLPMNANPFDQTLSDRIVGQISFDGTTNSTTQNLMVRHQIIDQLTFDPTSGTPVPLAADGPVLLGWGSRTVLDVRVDGAQTRRTATVLYDIALPVALHGDVAFGPDLMRSTVIASDAQFFNKDPTTIGFGGGSATIAYRPIGLSGAFSPKRLTVELNFPGNSTGGTMPSGNEIEPGLPACSADKAVSPCSSPSPSATPDCLSNPCDEVGNGKSGTGMPGVAIFDVEAGAWRGLADLQPGPGYQVKDPARYVDPSSGTVLFKFSAPGQDGVGFSFNVWLEGTAK
jgi:hypothetical protein